jgi:hypothetical protein
MRRVVVPLFSVLVLLLAGLLSGGPAPSAAQDATPVAGMAATPDAGCAEADEAAIDSQPPGTDEAVVNAAWMGDDDLYLGVLTIPENSCIAFRARPGAIILYVQQGTIVYEARLADMPDVSIVRGDSDGEDTANVAVTPGPSATEAGEEVTLNAGDWITQDRRVWFTFRNDGPGEAIVSAAAFGVPPWRDDCGGCSGRGRP